MKKTLVALALAGAFMPATAFAQDSYSDEGQERFRPADAKAGFRLEGRAFYERISDPDLDAEIVYEFGDGFGGGVEAGFDFAVGDTFVAGPYATLDFSSTETCEEGLCLATPQYWAVGLHAGLTTGTTGLIYAKLGYGQQEVTLEGTFEDPDFGTITLDESETGGGYNFGLGYEHGFGEMLYGRVEVGVSESYDIYEFDMQRGYLGLALGTRF